MSNKKPAKSMKAMALSTSIISYLVGPVLVGLFGGKWIDGLIETSPLFMIIGLLLGLAAGVYGLIRLVNGILGEDEDE